MHDYASSVTDVFFPLTVFYRETGKPLPRYRAIDGDAMPEPYRKLLVHEDDMTPTLEAFYDCTLTLQLLNVLRDDSVLTRNVVLRDEVSWRPIEFGAIRIDLSHFGDQTRGLVEGCHVPLGTILNQYNIEHACHPSTFIELDADDVIQTALELPAAAVLYGRRNVLTAPDGRTIADVVEILSPCEEAA